MALGDSIEYLGQAAGALWPLKIETSLGIAGARGESSMRFIHFCETYANGPENHQEQGRDAKQSNDVCRAQDVGKQVRPRQEQ